MTFDQKPGEVSILSHSGGIGVTAFNRSPGGARVHSLVSLGNEADVDLVDVLESLLVTDAVTTIALVIEQPASLLQRFIPWPDAPPIWASGLWHSRPAGPRRDRRPSPDTRGHWQEARNCSRP